MAAPAPIVGVRLHRLDADTDASFRALYEGRLQEEAWQPLRGAAPAYFSAHPNDHHAADRFFENFTQAWRAQIRVGRIVDADVLWKNAIQLALDWEQANAPTRIHKGLAFYFWGMTALIGERLDIGYSLMHQALSEDRLTRGRPDPPTPAFWFAVMDVGQVDQAFRPWLQAQVDYLEPRIAQYRAANGKALTLPDFGRRFLTLPESHDSAARFGHAVARLMRFVAMPPYAIANDFAGQLLGEPLADILLIIEVGARARSATGGLFLAQATALAAASGLQLTDDDLRQVNATIQPGNIGIDATLRTLLDGLFTISTSPVVGLARDLAVAYALRNHGAHNTAGVPVLRERFADVQQAVLNTLFLLVETWY